MPDKKEAVFRVYGRVPFNPHRPKAYWDTEQGEREIKLDDARMCQTLWLWELREWAVEEQKTEKDPKRLAMLETWRLNLTSTLENLLMLAVGVSVSMVTGKVVAVAGGRSKL